VVGKVISSSNATVEGSALLSNGTILSGDAVKVGAGGSVLLSFSPTARASLTAATQVRFSGSRGRIEAQLLAGALSVERESKDAFVVETGAYRFEPKGEGKAEFRVALVPDKGTLIETRHGQLAITETHSGERYTLAEGLLAQIPPSAPAAPGQTAGASNVVGNVTIAAGAMQNGSYLSGGETVRDNDLIATGAAGRVTVELSPTTHVTLNENTSGRFSKTIERVWLRLEKGKVVAESRGEGYLLIATSRFYISPTSTAPSQLFVWVLIDNSTYVEALTGDVRIEDLKTERSYVLPAGQNTMIPENATDVPGLQPLPGAATPPPPAPTPPSTPPSTPNPPTVTTTVKSHSHTTAIIILGVAGGAGAATAAILAETGGKSSSVSPTTP
jgi:ferric-dicitrate binding protein FerR (iron transport regulator)